MPIRTCVGCRRTDEQEVLVRIAMGEDDGPVVSRTAPGRGAWLHPGCGALALKRRSIPRALRSNRTDHGLLAAVVDQVDALAGRLGKSGPERVD